MTFSELSSWATFAIGWAFCNVLAGLVNSPTKTAELNKICLEQLQLLLHVYEASTGSFELILGILIAFPRLSVAIAASSSPTRKSGDTTASCSNEETEIVQKIKIMARCDLEVFLENQQQGFSAQLLARLLGAPWVIAFSDRAEASQDDIKSDTGLLDRTLLAATSRRDLQPQLVHFTVPFCHMIHTNLDVRNPASHEISLFTGRVHSLVNLIRITPTSAARHTAVVALASLFGVDWCRGPTVMSMGSNGLFSYFTSSNNPVAMTSVSNSALTTLMELSGLSISITTDVSKETTGVGTLSNAYAMAIPASKAPSAKSALMVQDLKAGRLAAMVLGHIACHFHRLGQADVGKVIGTSSEPKDYSRLPTSTSWLRALWDGMWEPLQMGTVQRSRKSYRTALEVMLYTVYNLPAPLPAVNWFPLLTQLVALEPRLIIPAIHMASRHANTSTSLMEFLIMQLSGFKIGDVVSSSKETKEPKEGREEEEGHGVEELYVGEEGLGRILALGGLPLVVFGGGDQVLVELDKVRGLGGIAKKVSLPSSRVIDVMEKLSNELFFAVGNCSDVNVTERASERQDPQKEVLQLLFLDTLSNHIRPYRQGQGCSAAAGKSSGGDGISAVGTAVAAASATQNKAINNQNTLTEDAKELLSELRAVILRVFYRVSFNNFLTAQRVLRRLADLSLTSLSHLDAAQLDTSLDATTGDRGSRVLKEAIGISSLYRAGYLTSQQEARLIRTAQSALLIVSDTSLGIQNRKFAESAISVLLYAMNSGVAERRPPSSLSMRRKKRNAQRFTWLQRILDLLVLFSNQYEAFSKGVTLLLGGAVLLWWDEKDIVSGFSLVDLRSEGLGGSSLQTLDNIDDTEVGLLANVDEHDLEHGDDASENNATAGMDHNSLEDDEFELWHQQFVQGISVDALTSEGAQEQYHHHQKMNEDGHQRNIMGRVSLILPDIIMNIRGRTASPTSSDGQTASRLLRMALDTQINPTERQFLIGLLRRIEDLVPIGQTWILK
ncbi:hypothetical protein BX616_007564 [Lobosporangium transversale]|nr:hypothetical protein BX616_007564 [Lobosporangium transversale]